MATVWMHDAHPCYMLFGMLGAMSASFVCWVPNRKSKVSDHVSLLFLPCTVMSLVCIHYLPRTITLVEDFSFWLKLLHVMLVFPQLTDFLLPNFFPKMNGKGLYFLLGLLILVLHWCDLVISSSARTFPITDCQLSITYDLVLCSLVTIYAINVDTGSIVYTTMAFLLLPLVPPGVILALHLFLQKSIEHEGVTEFHSLLVTRLQEFSARRRASNHPCGANDGLKTPLWMNLGQGWAATDLSYAEACKNLASSLGNHMFKAGDGVLACGCGYGAELLFWKETFSLSHITGIDTNTRASLLFPATCNVRLLPVPVSEIRSTFENKANFNKIVALDSVYHFDNKMQFFSDCASLLPSQGSVGVTDLIVRQHRDRLPLWLTLLLRAMNVNINYLWTEDEYREQLLAQGWKNVHVKPFETVSVLAGWFPSSMLEYFEYAIIVAERPKLDVRSTKKRVAVIGSGLSGLVAAHSLSSDFDVTMYEANEKGGLSGKGEHICGQLVDIPLRIIGEGYYNTVEDIAKKAYVRLEPIRNDYLTQRHYSDDRKSISYSRSHLTNLISFLPYLSELTSFRKCLYATNADMDKPMSACETWGTWMARHGYETSMYQLEGDAAEQNNSKGGKDSYIMWVFMGQASWMLSCSYKAVLDYPARILLNFFRDLNVGSSVVDAVLNSGSEWGRMLRVHPSMEALEHALSYGIKTHYGCPVSNVGKEKTINGEEYDAIVLATEALAIKHVMSKDIYSPVFSDVRYQASSIYLHTDTSLLPPNKEDWNSFNVCQDSTQEMCMLTAWLNEYYADSEFPTDVFQTWNPHVIPAEDKTIKAVHFQRVVHSADTPRILAEIEKLQGVNNFYYAGAYSVYGMGLLEQAALSGQQVAERIKSDLQ